MRGGEHPPPASQRRRLHGYLRDGISKARATVAKATPASTAAERGLEGGCGWRWRATVRSVTWVRLSAPSASSPGGPRRLTHGWESLAPSEGLRDSGREWSVAPGTGPRSGWGAVRWGGVCGTGSCTGGSSRMSVRSAQRCQGRPVSTSARAAMAAANRSMNAEWAADSVTPAPLMSRRTNSESFLPSQASMTTACMDLEYVCTFEDALLTLNTGSAARISRSLSAIAPSSIATISSLPLPLKKASNPAGDANASENTYPAETTAVSDRRVAVTAATSRSEPSADPTANTM